MRPLHTWKAGESKGPCTKLYCLSLVFWYKDKRCGPCTHQRPLHLFLWPLHISKWPLHLFLFMGFVALAHGPCTSSRGPCTGPCSKKMLLFGRLSGRHSYILISTHFYHRPRSQNWLGLHSVNSMVVGSNPTASNSKFCYFFILALPFSLLFPYLSKEIFPFPSNLR